MSQLFLLLTSWCQWVHLWNYSIKTDHEKKKTKPKTKPQTRRKKKKLNIYWPFCLTVLSSCLLEGALRINSSMFMEWSEKKTWCTAGIHLCNSWCPLRILSHLATHWSPPNWAITKPLPIHRITGWKTIQQLPLHPVAQSLIQSLEHFKILEDSTSVDAALLAELEWKEDQSLQSHPEDLYVLVCPTHQLQRALRLPLICEATSLNPFWCKKSGNCEQWCFLPT